MDNIVPEFCSQIKHYYWGLSSFKAFTLYFISVINHVLLNHTHCFHVLLFYSLTRENVYSSPF